MEAMDFDPDTLLTCAGSDPMLGKVPDSTPASSNSDLSTSSVATPAAAPTAASAPSGSFIVLKNSAPPGVLGRVTQLGNINLSSLAPGQGARAASSRLTAVMGRAAGSTPGALTKFIISPSSQAPGSAAVVTAAPAAPGQQHVRMVSAAAAVRLVPGAVSHQFRPLAVDQLASPTKTITLTTAQAQQMGLFSPKKMPDGGVRTVASPQRIVIKSSPSLQSKQVAVSASSGPQSFRVLAQSSIQQSVAGRQGVQFVRVVGSAAGSASQGQYVTPAVGAPPNQDHTLPAAGGGGSNSVKIAIAPSQSAQRLLLPAAPLSAGLDQMRSDVTPSPAGRPTSRAAGTTRHRVVQSGAARSQVNADAAHRSQISASMRTQPTQAVRVPNRGDGAPLIRPRKPCNCTKSQCLKLYCDCFASGEFCNNCNCNNCNNSLDHEEERQRAIRACLDRNPYAFKPKIGKSDNETRKHQKGCNCKKSGCLKNYCECYEAKINCSSQCKCIGCKNSESAPSRQGRPGAGAAGSIDEDLSFMIADGASVGRQSRRSRGLKVATFPVPDRSPLVRVTQDVIDATLQCLMAESCEPGEPELRVLNEFGRCISQIIDYGSRRGDPLDGMV